MRITDSESTYSDLEQKFASLINDHPHLCPPGTLAKVKICHADGRKVRGNAVAAKHYTDDNIVEISFEAQAPVIHSGAKQDRPSPLRQLLVKSLTAVEAAGQRDYIVLTWFRDKHLPTSPQISTYSASEIHTMLTDLIHEGLILVDKVPHPKDPKIPVSTVRVNRSHREVQQIIGVSLGMPQPTGRTLRQISGPPLSQTILDGRR